MSTFETKEQYLNYISAWKSATNAEEAKSKRVVCDHVQYNWNYPGYTDEEKARFEEKGYTDICNHYYTIPDGGHRKETGWLTASHYLFNNCMRGKDPKRGFIPKSKRKLEPGMTPWHKFEHAAWTLEYVIRDAEAYVEHLGLGKGHNSLSGGEVKKFLAPFGGKIEIEDLLRIDKEELANARKFHR
jgi:hypothetical protein